MREVVPKALTFQDLEETDTQTLLGQNVKFKE